MRSSPDPRARVEWGFAYHQASVVGSPVSARRTCRSCRWLVLESTPRRAMQARSLAWTSHTCHISQWWERSKFRMLSIEYSTSTYDAVKRVVAGSRAGERTMHKNICLKHPPAPTLNVKSYASQKAVLSNLAFPDVGLACLIPNREG